MPAEIAVGLLLFGPGLEFSLSGLKPVRSIALLGTALQLALTKGYRLLLGRLFGMEWTTGPASVRSHEACSALDRLGGPLERVGTGGLRRMLVREAHERRYVDFGPSHHLREVRNR